MAVFAGSAFATRLAVKAANIAKTVSRRTCIHVGKLIAVFPVSQFCRSSGVALFVALLLGFVRGQTALDATPFNNA